MYVCLEPLGQPMTKDIQYLDFDDLVAQMRADCDAGVQIAITKAPIMYQMSPADPGMIERIFEDGTRDVGIRENGKFTKIHSL